MDVQVINLLIVGPNGNMGRALVKAAAEHPRIAVVGAVGPKGRDYIGVDLGLLVGLGKRIGARVFEDIRLVIDESDVVLECTKPAVSMDVLEACLKHRKAFVTGTTGFSEEQAREIRDAGAVIPVLRASNASPIVHLLYELIRLVTREVGGEADIDVVEMHHSRKLDAPSGTAREIGGIIAEELGLDLDEVAEYGREGSGARASPSIQFNSIRSGGVPSTHKVVFGFTNERLELSHQVYTRDAFAGGLIKAVLFISSKKRGYYTLEAALAQWKSERMGNLPHGPGTRPAIPVVSIVGYSSSGKTTLLEKLIRELKQRGYRLAAIKHHHHRGLQFDEPGKDSWRFAQAGADQVVIAGPDRVIRAHTFEEEPTLERVIADIRDVDLILIEGFKQADVPKIEINRGQPESELISPPDNLVAIVADRRFGADVPQFDLDDVAGLADVIEVRFLT
jgi:4-hydroxy-tetrahydrodipicolinate reductase